MPQSGDQSEVTAGTIRVTPRPVRPEAESDQEEQSIIRPDRTRMDPLSLDRSASKKVVHLFEQELMKERQKASARSDGYLLRGAAGFLLFLLLAGLWWWFGSRPSGKPVVPAVSPVQKPVTTASTDPALVMFQEFLAAPGVAGKSAFVLDAERVRPLMESAYAKGILPESFLRPGVPQRQAHGITLLPARVASPSPYRILIFCREKEGRLLLDWETYYQEMSHVLADFTNYPGSPRGVFRVVLERTHSFEAGPDVVCVRLAAPGHEALTESVVVAEEARASITDGLPWSQRRRGLARLEWEKIPGKPFRIVLRELKQWDFVP